MLALLVEQKPLRTTMALGERQAASNVLYAVPISDVITASGWRCGSPRRIDSMWRQLPPGMVARPDLLDDTVGQVIAAKGGNNDVGLVLLRGPSGVGKTVLASQIAQDVRVWAEFTDGIVMLEPAKPLQPTVWPVGCRERWITGLRISRTC